MGGAAPGHVGRVTSHDREVDHQQLGKAAQRLVDLVRLVRQEDLAGLVPGRDDLGHPVVWSAVGEFAHRWETGVDHLCRDVEEIAGRVGRIALARYEAGGP